MHRTIRTLAHLTALIGGLVLLALVIMTTTSIAGRTAGLGEITGNYEVLEAGVAFAIFSFLPITQLYGAHATVDVFTAGLPKRANRWLAAFWEVVLAAAILLIVWRLFDGALSNYQRGGTTTFLQFPLWWPYAASVLAGGVACLTALYCAVCRMREAGADRDILPSEHGEH
ncbi:MAG: TRAP transporter small permease [Pseudomonadota bacterium]